MTRILSYWRALLIGASLLTLGLVIGGIVVQSHRNPSADPAPSEVRPPAAAKPASMSHVDVLQAAKASDRVVDRELVELLQDTTPDQFHWESVYGLPRQLALFHTVFWEPRDTDSLRSLIRDTPLVADRTVFEIGTGSGLLSLCCLQAGAKRVVATDVNPSALCNAAYNAFLQGVREPLELRRVPLDDAGAFSVLDPAERFDLILSNPPWEDAPPTTIDTYALYDERFQLLQSLLEGLRDHLNPGGRALLAYGCVSAIRRIQELAPALDLQVRILDDRALEDLPEVFLPGILLEVEAIETD